MIKKFFSVKFYQDPFKFPDKMCLYYLIEYAWMKDWCLSTHTHTHTHTHIYIYIYIYISKIWMVENNDGQCEYQSN